MTQKEYEMPEEYQRNLQIWLEMLEQRDEYAKAIPHLPPDDRAKALPVFEEFKKSVATIELELAKEYEKFQAEKRREAEIDAVLAKAEVSSERLYIIIKHTKPHLFEEFHRIAPAI